MHIFIYIKCIKILKYSPLVREKKTVAICIRIVNLENFYASNIILIDNTRALYINLYQRIKTNTIELHLHEANYSQ